jgi:hypothetical protein
VSSSFRRPYTEVGSLLYVLTAVLSITPHDFIVALTGTCSGNLSFVSGQTQTQTPTTVFFWVSLFLFMLLGLCCSELLLFVLKGVGYLDLNFVNPCVTSLPSLIALLPGCSFALAGKPRLIALHVVARALGRLELLWLRSVFARL